MVLVLVESQVSRGRVEKIWQQFLRLMLLLSEADSRGETEGNGGSVVYKDLARAQTT